MSSTEALNSFLRWRKIMKMFCSAERSCKVLLQESFCNFSFKDFFLQMPISLFSFLFFSHYLEMRNVVEQSIKVSFYLCPPPLPTNPRRRVLWTIAERRLTTVRFPNKRSILGYREYSVGAITCNPLMSTPVPSGWILCTAECWILSAMMNNVEAPPTPPSPQHQTQTLFPKGDSSWRYGVGKMARTWANKPDCNLEELLTLRA